MTQFSPLDSSDSNCMSVVSELKTDAGRRVPTCRIVGLRPFRAKATESTENYKGSSRNRWCPSPSSRSIPVSVPAGVWAGMEGDDAFKSVLSGADHRQAERGREASRCDYPFCQSKIDDPHWSTHVPGTINVEVWTRCSSPVPKMLLLLQLWKDSQSWWNPSPYLQSVAHGSKLNTVYLRIHAAVTCTSTQRSEFYGTGQGTITYADGSKISGAVQSAQTWRSCGTTLNG
jgi:hypothetical protein